uniref:Protein sleepless n=1 Tax=Megaselia scalaris TaxID=36166 RepID=T1GG82_MEGSC
MWSKGVLVICVAFFVSNTLAANKCWYDKCLGEDDKYCKDKEVVCTQELAMASITYLRDEHGYTIESEPYSSNYDCFKYGVRSFRQFSNGTDIRQYEMFKSCIPQNVKVCELSTRKKREAELTDGGTRYVCNQCSKDLCETDSSISIIGSWKLISGIVLVLLIKEKIHKL